MCAQCVHVHTPISLYILSIQQLQIGNLASICALQTYLLRKRKRGGDRERESMQYHSANGCFFHKQTKLMVTIEFAEGNRTNHITPNLVIPTPRPKSCQGRSQKSFHYTNVLVFVSHCGPIAPNHTCTVNCVSVCSYAFIIARFFFILSFSLSTSIIFDHVRNFSSCVSISHVFFISVDLITISNRRWLFGVIIALLTFALPYQLLTGVTFCFTLVYMVKRYGVMCICFFLYFKIPEIEVFLMSVSSFKSNKM